MTLQNGMIYNGRAYLWTDTLIYNGRTGQPVGVMEKSFHGLIQPYAGTFSVWGCDTSKIIEAIATDNPQNMRDLVKAAQLAMMENVGDGIARMLLACCWDEPHLISISSVQEGEHEPFTAVALEQCFGPEPKTVRRLDHPNEMRAVIEAQIMTRNASFAMPDMEPTHIVGGPMALLTVAYEGVTVDAYKVTGEAQGIADAIAPMKLVAA